MHTRLPFFGVIELTGEERHTFLHNQLSNDINNLQTNQACYATYNTPKGRVIANLLVHNAGDALRLILARDLCETVAKRLKMFVLRAKVNIAVLDDWGVSGSLKEDTAPHIAQSPSLAFPATPEGGIELPHSGSLKAAPVSELPAYHTTRETLWNRHEIRSGYPWICAATTETCVAQMLNQHIIGGIHFRKGCYPGQEIIARAQYRGQVKRGLAIFHTPTPVQAGDNIADEQGSEAGLVLNAVSDMCLSVIKHGAHGHDLHVSGSPLQQEHALFDTTVADETQS